MSTILHGCLPDTTYFEITARSGNQYGVWVTTPSPQSRCHWSTWWTATGASGSRRL